MPNLVDNYVQITFAQTENDKRITEIVTEIEKGNFFNYFWPILLYSESRKRQLWENEQIVLRNLCLAGWGTKREAEVHEVTVNNIFYKEHLCWQNTICVSFFTAWSAPIKLYRNIVPLGYQVYAEFYDGSDNTGGIVYTADNILYETYCQDTTNPNDPIRRKIDSRFGISEYEQMQRDEAFSE